MDCYANYQTFMEPASERTFLSQGKRMLNMVLR